MTTMKKQIAVFTFLVSVLLVGRPAGAADIRLMTQNQYVGAEITKILAASTPEEFNAAIVTALKTMAANIPMKRAEALAAEIAKDKPALVGLQEVYRFQCTDLAPPSPGQGCNDPSIAAAFSDQLQATLDALNGMYEAKAQVINLNLTGIPFWINGVPALISALDRDVILARSDVDNVTAVDYTVFQPMDICLKPSADGCSYTTVIQTDTLLGPLSIERGYVAVDATVNGREYRVVNTHLEVQYPDPTNPLSQVFQAAQAYELIQILLFTTPMNRSIVVLGDMNSGPEHPEIPGPLPLPEPFNLGIVTPYQQFVAAGFADIWTFRPGGLPGFTCCQLEDLSNKKSILYERVDMIFSLDIPKKVKKVRVVGATISNKTRPSGLGLWPSDHASVTAELRF
jgi:hypothetical protein